MSRNQWLLVEWVDERNVFPSYGVVNADSLVTEESDLHVGKMTFVRSKHGNSARRAQILRISEDKRLVKEHKLLMERQDHQVKNMLSLCMRTIKEMKTDTLLYGSLASNQQTIAGNPKAEQTSESSSNSDSDDEEEISNKGKIAQNTKSLVKTPAQLKRINDYYNERAESPSAGHSGTHQKRKSIVSSTPLPPSINYQATSKLMFDQATQTDEVQPPSQIPIEKVEQMENILNRLYNQFLVLVGRLQIDCQDYSMNNSEGDHNGTAGSEENNHEPIVEEKARQSLNNSTVEAKDPRSCNAKSLQVRRVSAHTTNMVEQNFPVDSDMVPLGAGHAIVPTRLMNEINWESYSSATRQLLQAIFPRKILATHSLTGKKSPAFANKPVKKCLDPKLIEDIVETVSERCGVSRRLVRSCITIKCTDEAKLYRNRMQGRNLNQVSAIQENLENVPPSPVMSRPSSNESA